MSISGFSFLYSSLPTGGPMYAAQRVVRPGLAGVERAEVGTCCGSGSGRWETKLDLVPDELAELDLLVEDVEVGVVEGSCKLTFLETGGEDNSALPLALALATISFCFL